VLKGPNAEYFKGSSDSVFELKKEISWPVEP